MADMKRLNPVLVVWHDILDHGADWHHDGDADPKPVRVNTVGFLKAETKQHIVIARDYYDLAGKRAHGGLIAIPRGCIVSITELGSV